MFGVSECCRFFTDHDKRPTMQYNFELIRADGGPLEDPSILRHRPFVGTPQSFENDAQFFEPGADLATAMNTALALGEPLLVTGEPGTGKTQAAYFLAYRLGVPLIHFQVKSESTARDLLYQFDSVRYFHDASTDKSGRELDKETYIEYRGLGKAMVEAVADEKQLPRVVLLDEIDKAPRDFPNDLLLELDQMRFTINETGKEIRAQAELRPIVVITSNSERRLPEPFLRRCVYHHIVFDDDLVWRVVEKRRGLYAALSDQLVQLAVQRFLQLRDRDLRKIPATGELLAWLQVLAHAYGTQPEILQERLNDSHNLKTLPYLGVLLKDHQDTEDLM
jgi:MoxR-like ATPase